MLCVSRLLCFFNSRHTTLSRPLTHRRALTPGFEEYVDSKTESNRRPSPAGKFKAQVAFGLEINIISETRSTPRLPPTAISAATTTAAATCGATHRPGWPANDHSTG